MMKKLKTIIGLLLMMGVSAHSQCVEFVDVFIIIAQSNGTAAGGFNPALAPPANGVKIWTVNNTAFSATPVSQNDDMVFGVNTDSSPLYGPGEIIAAMHAANTGRDVFVFKHTKPGSPLHENAANMDWNGNSTNELRDKLEVEWPAFLADLTSRGKVCRIVAVIFIQGLGDNIFADQYTDFFIEFRSYLDGFISTTPPWIVWSLNQNQFITDVIRNPRVLNIRNQQLTIFPQIPNTFVYDTFSLTLMPDEAHYDNGSIILGAQDTYNSLLPIWHR